MFLIQVKTESGTEPSMSNQNEKVATLNANVDMNPQSKVVSIPASTNTEVTVTPCKPNNHDEPFCKKWAAEINDFDVVLSRQGYLNVITHGRIKEGTD